ncbi:hypothetical protein VAEU17_4280016 [Vibrio aestuarianus]|nr:hypothetical protein VAEKB19_3780007 [Vibrio aestuarianus]CAH8218499.1 hypothetical protein VAEU17_4280016 [Vibrio aestuarianus]
MLHSRLKRLVRKNIGFSKSEEMHDKVIGTFMNKSSIGRSTDLSLN